MKNFPRPSTYSQRDLIAGFTLIEMTLALAIGAVSVGMLASCFVLIFETEARVSGMRELREQGEQVMRFLTQKIRNADEIVLPEARSSGNALYFVSPGNTAESAILFTDGKLWFADAGTPSLALTNSQVRVEEFSVDNEATSAEGGAVHILIRLSMPLENFSPSARTATYTMDSAATMRSQKHLP